MSRLNIIVPEALKALGYNMRARIDRYGHREYRFTSVNRGSFTLHLPDHCPKCLDTRMRRPLEALVGVTHNTGNAR